MQHDSAFICNAQFLGADVSHRRHWSKRAPAPEFCPSSNKLLPKKKNTSINNRMLRITSNNNNSARTKREYQPLSRFYGSDKRSPIMCFNAFTYSLKRHSSQCAHAHTHTHTNSAAGAAKSNAWPPEDEGGEKNGRYSGFDARAAKMYL